MARGAAHLAAVLACIDRLATDARAPRAAGDPGADAAVAASIAGLRAVLEWTTYQSAALATARALLVARRTRSFVERFDLLGPAAPPVAALESADEALVADVRTRNGYMTALAQRHPHLALPPPLVSAASLAARPVRKPGRLELIGRLMKDAPSNDRL